MSRLFGFGCLLLTLFHVLLWAEEPKDALEKQLGCPIQYHKVPLKQPKTWVIPEQMVVRVTDAGKKPLPGASVCLADWFPGDSRDFYYLEKRENDPKTDRNGTVVLSLEKYRGKTPGEIVITVTCGENYLPFRYSWEDHPERTGATIDVPKELDVALESGEMVTWTVLDKNGKGIPDVKVTAAISRNATFNIGMLSHFWGSQYETTSDAEGKFQVGPLVLKTGREKVESITLRHPDFASVKFDKPFGGPKRDSDKTLEEKSIPLALTMTPGYAVSGIVVDNEDKPIEGVTIYHLAKKSSFWLDDDLQRTQTDGEGRFRFKNLAKEEYTFSASIPGKYGDSVTVDLVSVSDPVKIVMKPTRTVRIRAVSEDGKVLPKIRVSPYFDGKSYDYLINEKTTRSLEDGTWEWFEVPPDKEISYSVYYDNGEFNEGYHILKGYVSENTAKQLEGERIEPYKFPPREEPYIVKMVWQEKDASNFIPYGPRRDVWAVPKKMVIRVLDSETGLPAPNIPVMMQYGTGNTFGYSRVMPEFQTDENGLVALDFSDVDRKGILFIAFKIEKENYATWGFERSSDPIRGDNRTGAPIPPIIDVLLSYQGRGAEHGIVLDENRKPIQGARVVFGYSMHYDEKTTRMVPYYSDISKYASTLTDELGRWSWNIVNSSGNRYSVYILCDGYVNHLATAADTNGVQFLHKGKEVKGRVLDQAGNPISGARVYVQQQKISNEHVAVTDEQGGFTHFLGTTVNGNQVQLTAIMEGKTPATITVDPSETGECVIVMPPGKPLTIRLKTTDGSPLPALRQFSPFAFSLLLKTSDGYNLKINADYKVNLAPDKNGVIYWPDAPDTETLYQIFFDGGYFVKGKNGGRDFYPQKLKPRPEEYVFEVIKE
ncbi:MAG: carboxypeptidase-like regulatory domain-containing protein [Planctomycetaceae bacterium]|nr:carboxypeptidase-like regulatory domain-containing protein [Planctomycetaceae bacterium]